MNSEDIIAAILGGSIILIVIFALIAVAFAIVTIVAQWKLFKKAGKNGWEAIIPYYSTYVLIQIAGLNWWYFLIAIAGAVLSLIGINQLSWLTTIAGYFVNFLIYYNIAKKTKQNEILYGILGAIIPFVPVLILGFSKKITFDNTVEVSPNGVFGESKASNNQNQTPERYCLGCGHKLGDNVQFCENCGKKVEEPQI